MILRATVAHYVALISISVVLSQALVRPQTLHHVVCLFTPKLLLVLYCISTQRVARLSCPEWLTVCRPTGSHSDSL